MGKLIKHHPLVKLEFNDKLISKSGEFRIYRNAKLLSPGEWTNMFSPVPTYYSPTVLSKYATNWSGDIINLDHSRDVLKRLGYIKNPYWDGSSVRVDLYILSKTQNQKDTIALIDSKLINWLSAELLSEDSWNNSKNMPESKFIEFLGVAVVSEPGCSESKIVE